MIPLSKSARLTGRAVWRKRRAELLAAREIAPVLKKPVKVDFDVVHARITRGFAGKFEAEVLGGLMRALVLGKEIDFIYNDCRYTVKTKAVKKDIAGA